MRRFGRERMQVPLRRSARHDGLPRSAGGFLFGGAATQRGSRLRRRILPTPKRAAGLPAPSPLPVRLPCVAARLHSKSVVINYECDLAICYRLLERTHTATTSSR